MIHALAPRAARRAAALLALLVVGLFAGRARPARADGSQVRVEYHVVPPDPKDPKTKDLAPSIEATVIGGQNPPLDKYALSVLNNKVPVVLKATSIKKYNEGREPMAVALVIQGQEYWVGNEDVEPDESKKQTGALKDLATAIDKLQLGAAGPPGSLGVIISYSTGVETKQPLGPLSALTGAALGSQKDYRNKINTDMVAGLTEAVTQLKKARAVRKVMIVVGDGTDTNPETAKNGLAELKKQVQAEGIEAFGIVYKSSISDPTTVLTSLIPGAKTATSVASIGAEMSNVIARMDDRVYVTFPGYDPKLKVGAPWDGKEHGLTLKIDQTETEEQMVALVPVWRAAKEGGLPWWLFVVIPLVLIALVVVAVKVFGQRSQPVAPPMPVAAPVVAAEPAAPPKPAGPMKTVMFSTSGDSDGFPIVGWIVALNGPNAFQTQKLQQGVTKIGTSSASHIVVNDGFMSTDHCQIVMSPSGFVLQDNKSTNGCYVNDRKVERHELVDNDTFTLGKTNFKFKSIN